MSLSPSDYQQAVRISRALEDYFAMTGKVVLRSTEVYPYLQRQGLVPKDRHNGIYFRKFLKRLKRNHALNLIPQCEAIDQDEVFTNWYFRSAKKKMQDVFRVNAKEKALENSKGEESVLEVTREDAVAMLDSMLKGEDPITGQKEPAGSWLHHERTIAGLKLIRSAMGTAAHGMERPKKPVPEMTLEQCAETISAWPLKRPTETQSELVAEVRRRHPRAYEPWSDAEDDMLRLFDGEKAKVLAEVFQRQASAIKSRREKI